jgi:hypothetical protein
MKPLKIIKNFRYFESQEEGEWVIRVVRKHWLALLSPFIMAVAVGAILLLFFGMSLDMGERLFGEFGASAIPAFQCILVMYVVLGAFGSWLIRYLNVIVLTNRHLVDVSQRAFFARSVSTLALENIEDVTIDKKGFVATIFDFGDLKIQTAGELPNFEIKSVGDPERVQKVIMEAKAGNIEQPHA